MVKTSRPKKIWHGQMGDKWETYGAAETAAEILGKVGREGVETEAPTDVSAMAMAQSRTRS